MEAVFQSTLRYVTFGATVAMLFWLFLQPYHCELRLIFVPVELYLLHRAVYYLFFYFALIPSEVLSLWTSVLTAHVTATLFFLLWNLVREHWLLHHLRGD